MILVTKLFCFLLVFLPIVRIAAQGTSADYRRSEAFDSLFKDKVYNNPNAFNWLSTEHKFWYLNLTREGKLFMIADVQKKTQKQAFDHVRLARELSQRLSKPVDHKSLPFEKLDFSHDLKSIE